MEWTTHVLSGAVVGYAVTGGDWKGAAVGGIAGIISDFDEPESHFSRYVYPVSYVFKTLFGHRTLLHSLLFTIIMYIILMIFTPSWVWLPAIAGILTHIAGDMLTGKVKFLYPLQIPVGIDIAPGKSHKAFMRRYKLIDLAAKTVLVILIAYTAYDKVIA